MNAFTGNTFSKWWKLTVPPLRVSASYISYQCVPPMAQPIPRVWPLGRYSWSTDMDNALLASLCMFQPFDLHHGSHLCLWESYQDITHALRENYCPIGESLLLTVLDCGICWEVRAPLSLNHPWNIYHHNLSSLDQLYTCHELKINYLSAPNKHLTHWFFSSVIWDWYTGRDFLSLVF